MVAKSFLNSKTQTQRISNILSEVWRMSNYNRKHQSMTLQEFVDNKFVSNIAFEGFEKEEKELSIIKLVLQDDPSLRLKTQWDLIPDFLKFEVRSLIDRAFQGNEKAFFKQVKEYFKSFTLIDLFYCNLGQKNLKNIHDQATRKNIARRLRNRQKNALWHASVLLRLVGKSNKNYCSNSLFKEFKKAKIKEKEFLKKSIIVGDDGKTFSLEEISRTAEQSLAEKYNIIKTMEEMAKPENKNWNWCFITLTLEGKFHPNPTKGKNSYDGTSPKESAKLLNNNIKKARALLAKRGICAGDHYMGCFTAEAHKDGVLHKHGLIYCSDETMKGIKDAYYQIFPNLNDESFIINNGKATASSYIFKYIFKATKIIDQGFDLENHTIADKEEHNAILNNAFRSFNQIRGFSFFGIENCLTKFRFLARNIKKIDVDFHIKSMIEKNDLFGLLQSGIFAKMKNLYVKDENGSQFVGCEIFDQKFIKRFFSLIKDTLKEKTEQIKVMNIHPKKAKKLIKKAERSKEVKVIISNSVQLASEKTQKMLMVILNPNFSREPQKAEKTKPKIEKRQNGDDKFYFEYKFAEV